MTWIGAAFIWIGVTIATAAGGIFEATLNHLIVKFGSLLQAIKPGIDFGWTALRDIANIVIIAMFVFIAINIILGVKEFGEKRLVARVLIIAVLINFSLLFTKAIIDASNFTAYQFYNSMLRGVNINVNQAVGSGDFETSLTSSGITGKFMKLLGVQGIASQDQERLQEYAKKPDVGGLYALGYGLLSFTLLLALAFVLLYGAFLIVSRAVLIVFLMLTSALAFASWLIPQQRVVKGFAQWWESLLKTALFAPILMALLWVTINVSDAFVAALSVEKGDGALGALASNPSAEKNALALLSFIFVLGLLYASFAAASAFSKTISGFRFAQVGVGGAVFGSLVVGSRLASFAGRNTVGWGGARALGAYRWFYNRPNEVDESGSIIRNREGRRTGLFGYLNRGVLRGTNALARSSFDPLSSRTAQTGVRAFGGAIAGGVMDSTKAMSKDFMKAMADKARRADELARQVGPTDAQKQQMREQVDLQRTTAQAAIEQQRAARDQFKAQERPRVEANIRAEQRERSAAEEAVRNERAAQSGTAAERAVTERRHESDMREIESRIEAARRDAVAQGMTGTEVEEALTELKNTRNEMLRAQQTELQGLNDRDREHRENLTVTERVVTQLNEAARTTAEHELNQHETVRGFDQTIQEMQRRMPTRESAVNQADINLRKSLLWDPRARGNVEDAIRSHQRQENWRDFQTAFRDELRSQGGGGTGH